MTVHARQLARLCRERMTTHVEESRIRRQPEQQQPAESAPTTTETIKTKTTPLL